MRVKRILGIGLCLALVAALVGQVGPLNAQSESSLQFAADFQALAATLENCPRAGSPGSPELTAAVAAIGDEDMQKIAAAVPNTARLSFAVGVLRDFCAQEPTGTAPAPSSVGGSRPAVDGSTKSVPTTVTYPTTPFPPGYPSGGNYDAFTATLHGYDWLDASTVRTNTNNVAGGWIAVETAREAALAGQIACQMASDSTASVPLCGVWGGLAEVQLAAEIVLDQAAFQDGLVDAAEIQAAYENSVIALHRIDELDQKIDEALRLLNTPEGLRNTDVPACSGQPCDWPEPNLKK